MRDQDLPKNARKLADDAIVNGWQATITTGRGALLNKKSAAGFDVVESVAVRLRSPDEGQDIRAFGVWIKKEGQDAKWKFDNGWAVARGALWGGRNVAPQGYRDLVGLLERDGS